MNNQNNSVTQTGVIPVYPKPEDYKVGGETSIRFEERTNDWTPYAPSNEKQSNFKFDTMSCTSFSRNNQVEFQLNYLVKENKLSAEALKFLKDNGYFDSNGKVNLSDRFLAIMSGTTIKGNDFRTVAETLRTIGAIPEADLPFGNCENIDQYLDKTVITQAMKDKALAFLDYFKFQWDWLFFDGATGFNEDYQVKDNIKQAPIQLGITTPATHAVTLYQYEPTAKMFCIFDQYDPFFFQNKADVYNPHFAIRGIITENDTPKTIINNPKYVFKMILTEGMRGREVMELQIFLARQGLMKQELSTGFFGPITKQAVRNFQMRMGISPTGNVGVKTNQAINDILKKKLN